MSKKQTSRLTVKAALRKAFDCREKSKAETVAELLTMTESFKPNRGVCSRPISLKTALERAY